MYSEADIDGAVAAGVIPADTARRFRAYMAAQKASPSADEEYVRFLTGFNDIFVSIAIALVVVATSFLAGDTGLGGLAVAVISWGLAEYFTARRRMALPSILLLLTFIGGMGFFGLLLVRDLLGVNNKLFSANSDPATIIGLAVLSAIVGASAYAHWRRFHVPITIAAGTGCVVLLANSFIMGLFPALRPYWASLLALSGLLVFALAVRWDMTDLSRTTRRSDVAFWLHLLAAPLIVHPLFFSLGLLSHGQAALSSALAAIFIYLLFGIVALLIDRRALLVSALGYVIYALASVLKHSGFIGQELALTALIAGAGLLTLSVFWHTARATLLRLAPPQIRHYVPAA
jgi:hypothetical protein